MGLLLWVVRKPLSEYDMTDDQFAAGLINSGPLARAKSLPQCASGESE